MKNAAVTARSLTPAMWHVVGQCSLAERWERVGQTWVRQWPDLVHGRGHVSMQTIRALISRGVLYEEDDLYGLTEFGVRVWICRPRPVTPATDARRGGA